MQRLFSQLVALKPAHAQVAFEIAAQLVLLSVGAVGAAPV